MRRIFFLLLTILLLDFAQLFPQRNIKDRDKVIDSGRISRLETDRRKDLHILPPRNKEKERVKDIKKTKVEILLPVIQQESGKCILEPTRPYNYVYNEIILTKYNLAMKHFELGDYYQATIYFTEWLVENPNDIDALYHRGLSYYQMEWYGYAIEDFKIVILLDNQFALAYYYRGLCRFYRDERNLAKIDLEIAYELGYEIAGVFLKKYF